MTGLESHTTETRPSFNHRYYKGALRYFTSNLDKETIERELLKDYWKHAHRARQPVVLIDSKEEYERLRASGDLLRASQYYLPLNPGTRHVKDWIPIVYRLLKTPLGLHYAKEFLNKGPFNYRLGISPLTRQSEVTWPHLSCDNN